MNLIREPGAPALPSPLEPVARLLRDLIQERIGVFFENDRIPSMLEKLEPRALANGCRSYLDYYYILRYDQKGTEEWRRVMDAFSVQETYFWRELDQIRALVDHIVPAWFRTTSSPFKIWSAACASGEEPYSIVMALKEAGWGAHPIEVYASDASEAALTKARLGSYRERSFRALPARLREKYFTATPEGSLLAPEIANVVMFQWANLVALEQFPVANLNAIFCRNVFIYFSPVTIKPVVRAFADRLASGDALFIGSSESLLKVTELFELKEIAGAFVYVRNGVR